MPRSSKTPADLARRLASSREPSDGAVPDDGFERETYCLPRLDAQATAKDWFERYPKDSFMTEVESWRVLENGLVEFTMRRLQSGA
jgi:hypothetical protein